MHARKLLRKPSHEHLKYLHVAFNNTVAEAGAQRNVFSKTHANLHEKCLTEYGDLHLKCPLELSGLLSTNVCLQILVKLVRVKVH